MRFALPALLVACAPIEAPVDDPFDPALAALLQQGLDDKLPAANAPGAVAAVRRPDGTVWIGTTGYADEEAERAPVPDDRFRLGSITKTFVASVVLELDAEGTLDLDDEIATWVPEAPYGDQITLRMLLSHASGLDDFVDRPEFLLDPHRDWTPSTLIALVADDPLLFEPGTGYSYSNAGFILLGMAIEAASGTSWAVHVHDRYLLPWWLLDVGIPTEYPGTDTNVVGYLGGQPATDLYNPAAAWSAGEMVSDADDLLRWGDALYSGEVLGAALTEQMTTGFQYPDGERSRYGMGCQIRRIADRATVGHSGSTIGFESEFRYDVETGLVTVVFVNDFMGDADAIDEEIWRVLVENAAFE